MVVSGKSGLVAACGSFVTGPISDHSSEGLVACPLNRLKVVMPMAGFCSTSLIGAGRTMTVSCWAYERQLKSAISGRHKILFIGFLLLVYCFASAERRYQKNK